MDGLSFIIVIAVFFMALSAHRKNAKLDAKIAQLSLRLNKLGDDVDHLRPRPFDAAATPASADHAAAPVEQAALIEDAAEAAVADHAAAPRTVETADVPNVVAANQNWKPASQPHAQPRDMEQALASRWFVWIGGLAIAIGGVLFVKYAFDSGWISPLLRCVLGFIFGILLILGGEKLRRTPLMRAQSSYVPAALTAAGLAIAFGSVYAAYALYALIAPITAFIVMALIGLAAFALSLVQGPLIAALGLLGSYATPTLIPSDNPSAWSFFPYLLIILGAVLAVLRARSWWWLGYAAVAASLAWGLLWALGGVYEAADASPLGLFALALGAAAFTGISGRAILLPGSGTLDDLKSIAPPLWIGIAGVLAGALVLCANVFAADHGFIALLLLLAGAAGVIAAAWFKEGLNALTWIMAALVFLTVGAWFEGNFTQVAYDEWGEAVLLLGPGARQFLGWLLAFGVTFVAAGYAGTRLKDQPAGWAGLAAGVAVAYGFLAAARGYGVLSSNQWILAAAVLALVFCGAIWSLRSRVDELAINRSLGFFAIAATCAAAFGLQEAFDRVWLSIALAVLVPLLAAASTRIRIALLGPIAAVVAGLVALRLFVAHDLWFGDASLPLGNHWPLYGYGLPVLAFWFASRLFGRSGFPKAVMALEGAALGLAIALVSLELRVIIAGNVSGNEPGLLESAAHVAAWLGAGYGLMHRQAVFSSVISLWGARLLIAAATLLAVAGNLVLLNPVLSGQALAGGLMINALLLAYLVPAILGLLITRKLAVLNWTPLRPLAGVLSLVMALAYLTLQTTRFFQGPEMLPLGTKRCRELCLFSRLAGLGAGAVRGRDQV